MKVLSTLAIAASASLQSTYQRLLDDITAWAKTNGDEVAIQIGWVSGNETFSVASGQVTDRQSRRPATPDDTFLYGSGTKPVTAAAVMRLVDTGAVGLNDTLAQHVDPLLRRDNGTSMVGLFGSTLAKATVGQVLRMAGGTPDFEDAGADPFDRQVFEGGDKEWPVYSFIRYAATQPPLCDPGQCTGYSSAAYELLGLVVAAHQPSVATYTDLNLTTAALPDPTRMPSLQFLGQHGPLSQALTAPGWAVNPLWGSGVVVQNQTASILGWTCGNMVGRAQDVAQFFWDLLGPSDNRVVSEESLAFMRQYKPMTVGWGKLINLYYGAGLMASQAAFKPPANVTDWGFYEGHGGSTYGFSSSQGFIPKVQAAFSVVSNTDNTTYSSLAACRMMVAVAEARGEKTQLG
mmetsp:Transcript_90306/g.206534  ORF Transcript_90306/g.206534 Transcript_90306/m.206534 type:complete len:404 (+) Transcript_90306:47-1258(+)